MEKRNAYFKDNLQLRSGETDELIIEGYFALFNVPTKLTDGLYEQIGKGAFTNSIKNNDVKCLYNHSSDVVLGRTGNGTLELHEDEKGLYGKVHINKDDKQALDIYARVKRGDISSCSFGFYPVKEEPIKYEDGVMYQVHEADTIEVSIVTFPQYPETEIKARSKQLEADKVKQLAVRKQQLLNKLKGFE